MRRESGVKEVCIVAPELELTGGDGVVLNKIKHPQTHNSSYRNTNSIAHAYITHQLAHADIKSFDPSS
jgi:hypothetical protein